MPEQVESIVSLTTEDGYLTSYLAREAAQKLGKLDFAYCEACGGLLGSYEYAVEFRRHHTTPFHGVKRRKLHTPQDCIKELRRTIEGLRQTLESTLRY